MDLSPEMIRQQIAADLLNLGVRPGGVLLMHSSLRALGLSLPFTDRCEIVISAFLDALGQNGTLLFPALSYASVKPETPVFDVNCTPVCVGALPEFFRTRPGTIRSLHPTHSVCGVGRRAAELLQSHAQDVTPCGPNSPFALLPREGGQILFLGCGLQPNTSMHAIEEWVEPPYLYGPEVDYTMLRADGSQFLMRVRRHGFRGWQQRYDRLENLLPNGLSQGQILQAHSHLVEAAVMWPAALAALRQDPLYFVEAIQ
jgi:aminoglycoside 3-N-acetyltransferase